MRVWDRFKDWVAHPVVSHRELNVDRADYDFRHRIDARVNRNREDKILAGNPEPLTNNERGDMKHFEDQAARHEHQVTQRREARQQGVARPELSRNRLHAVPDGAIRWQDFPADRSPKR